MEGLIKAGHKVTFWSQYVGLIEEHRGVEPALMKKSLITSIGSYIRHKTLSGGAAESEDLKKFIPSPVWVYNSLKAMKPDLVITRERSRVSRVISICCRLAGIEHTVLYVQEPYYHSPSHPGLRERIKEKILPGVIYTPVKYDPSSDERTYHDEHSYHLPLVYEAGPREEAVHKDYMPGGVLRLLDIGKYRDYKHHIGAIKAMVALDRDCPVHLTIIGQCESEDEKAHKKMLLSRIREYDIEDKVSLYDNIPYSEMNDLYQKYDMLLLPSKAESAGMVILEAMGNGLGVICTRTCGLAYCVEEAGAGASYDYDDYESLAAIIGSFCADPDRVRNCAEKAYDYIRDNNDFEAYYSSLKELMKREYGYNI
ncbi:glycosyltransferase [Butyrivibrio sp. MC2013]|uniref:glycosyltransferase n=1 Tax=Butyrivibrio sp. MC2013 TaxID=1280686 RepID=UPI000412774A|nr:glycosyltransferase [Butyrivibrio sp. MC2013]